MPLNTLILKARAKKLKYLAKQKELLANDDSDGDISDIEMDDETLSKYLGHFINDDHIGGFDDLFRLNQAGHLDKLLSIAS